MLNDTRSERSELRHLLTLYYKAKELQINLSSLSELKHVIDEFESLAKIAEEFD